VVICAPPEPVLDWFTAAETLTWHELPAGAPTPIYPVRRPPLTGWVSRFSDRHLLHPVRRHGAVHHAAGGRTGRLDLTAAVTRAHAEAITRWRIWAQIVRAIPPAKAWPEFTEPAPGAGRTRTASAEDARRRFDAQPRILAMLAYNANPLARVVLDPAELGAYQAGEATYTVLHWQHAIAGDALITEDGRLLQPASDTLADQLRHLTDATAHLRVRRRNHQLAALTIPCAATAGSTDPAD
jgi:hypothetical protein